MFIDFDTANNALPSQRPQRSDNQFATLMTQYATPLFSPWPTGDQTLRGTPPMSSASLSAHPTGSNRREGRHARE